MNSKKKYVVIILFSISLLTCIGGEIIYQSERVLVWPYKIYKKRDGLVMANEYEQENVRYHYQGSDVQPEYYTLNDLKEKWGFPSSSIESEGGTVYTFETGRSCWSGIRFYFIIPIPLMLPTDSERYLVTIEKDKVIGIKFLTSDYSGFQCGFLSTPTNWSTGKSGGFCRIR